MSLAGNNLNTNGVFEEENEPVPSAVLATQGPSLLTLPQQLDALPNEQLLTLWKTLNDAWPFKERDRLVVEMQRRKLFPENPVSPDGPISRTLLDGGLYPDTEDPNFVSRLLKKQEFADTASPPFDPTENACESGPDFEITPVQRFVATFLHPRTPYRSMLLYHGVGVGKTCAAIQAAEAYLDTYPRRPVLIVAPPNIQPGFERTIFDFSRLKIGEGETPNRVDGCTGDTYLKLTGCSFERDPKLIAFRVKKAIKYRYRFMGYRQFATRIAKVVKSVPLTGNVDVDEVRMKEYLRREFDYQFIVIDEAHNLADVKGTAAEADLGEEEKDEDVDTQGSAEEKEEARAGKILTPFLKKLLQSTTGIKLLLMTATPMFNSVFEIKFLLDLCLINDGKAEIPMDKILNADGTLAASADLYLKPVANAYVSFMRGENPNSFPLRLFPEGQDPNGQPVSRITVDNYPKYKLGRKQPPVEVSVAEKENMSKLPILKSDLIPGSLAQVVLLNLTKKKVATGGTTFTAIDSLLQAANCVFPLAGEDPVENPDMFVGVSGFGRMFKRKGRGVVEAVDASWLAEDQLAQYAPKLAATLRYVKKAKGVEFTYSRFVSNGALILALALEANGYTPWGRDTGYLANGIQSPGGRQCALCERRQGGHEGADHEFKPAKFILLTGDKELSPRNAEAIAAARSEANKDGSIIKLVLGSTIAGEGLDLRFIREVHILDAWFHLNKTEQIIGRGIRFRSHCSLDELDRNVTVFLHCVAFPVLEASPDRFWQHETADLYCYRYALSKAMLIGQMSRKLKIFAVDCNLRKGVTVLQKLGYRIQEDSQGQERTGPPEAEGKGVALDDMPFTAMCDWTECSYPCEPKVEVNLEVSDDTTYEAFSSKYREAQLQKTIQKMFAIQPYYQAQEFLNVLLTLDIPTTAVYMGLQGIVNNRLFRIQYGNQVGYVSYRNGYFVFQPDRYRDLDIPIAIRIADVPIKKDEFEPKVVDVQAGPLIDGRESEEAAAKGQSLWEMLYTWATGVARGDITDLDLGIERKLELYTLDFKQRKDVYTDKLKMALLLAERVKDRKAYEEVLLEYFWDEWMTVKEQVRLLLGYKEYSEIAPESIVVSGSVEAIRTISPDTNFLEFTCNDGKPCSSGVAEALAGVKDEVTQRNADVKHAGPWYGFIVPKRGIMTFKILQPHEVGKLPKGGQEICPRSGKGWWHDPLVILGDELTKAGLPNMNFDRAHLAVAEGITNNICGCTVVDLLLRYMDKLRVDGKRWFFRPVAAYYSGHRGLARAEAVVVAKSEAKEQHKAEVAAKKAAAAAEREAKKAAVAAAKAAVPEVSRALRFKGKAVLEATRAAAATLRTLGKPKITTAKPKLSLVAKVAEDADADLFNVDEAAAPAAAAANVNPFNMFEESAKPAPTAPAAPVRPPSPEIEFEEDEEERKDGLLSRVATPKLASRVETPFVEEAPLEAPAEEAPVAPPVEQREVAAAPAAPAANEFELEGDANLSLPAAPAPGGPVVAAKPKTAPKKVNKGKPKKFSLVRGPNVDE